MGTKFESIREASRKSGIPEGTLRARVNNQSLSLPRAVRAGKGNLKSKGSIAEASRQSGIPETTLRDRMRRYNMTVRQAVELGERVDLTGDLATYAIANGVNISTARDRQARGLSTVEILTPVSDEVRRASLIREVGLSAVVAYEWQKPLSFVLGKLAEDGCTQGDAAQVLSVNLKTLKKHFPDLLNIRWADKSDGLGTILLQRTKVDGQYQLDERIGSVPELAKQLGVARSAIYYQLEMVKQKLLLQRYTPQARRLCAKCSGSGCTPCRGWGTLAAL
jgi:hypothetical protein